jgi:hypothetical protein
MTGIVELLMFIGLLRLGSKAKASAPPGPMPTSPPPGEPPAPATSSATPSGVSTPAVPTPGTTETPTAPTVLPIQPAGDSTMPAIPWPQGPVPATLPVFPGSGWEPDVPITPEVSARAAYWNDFLWDTKTQKPRKPFVQENFGGQWLTFATAWHPGDKGPKTFMATEAWRVKQAAPAPAPAPAPTAAPTPAPAAASAPAPTPTAPPEAAPPEASSSPQNAPSPGAAQAPTVTRPASVTAHVLPYPGPNAWQANSDYIRRYQSALVDLGFMQAGQVDGKYGPTTKAAVLAYQATQPGLVKDGEAGQDTAAALESSLANAGFFGSPS